MASGLDGATFGGNNGYGLLNGATSHIPVLSGLGFDQFIHLINYLIRLMGLSAWISPQTVAQLSSNPLVLDSIKLLMLGSFIETGRRIFTWFLSLFTFRYSVSGEFRSGDPTYEWLVSYLTSHAVWRMPFDFQVESRTSSRKWRVDQVNLNSVDHPGYLSGPVPISPSGSGNGNEEDKVVPNAHTETSRQHHVDFIPAFSITQFFLWKGYLMEITTSMPNKGMGWDTPFPNQMAYAPPPMTGARRSYPVILYLKIYTRKPKALFSFVEECRLQYVEKTKPVVTVYSQGYPSGNPTIPWSWGNIQTKHRRPIESLVLDNNMAENLLKDSREFLALEDWYVKSGIPHRRGYLLYGPPGTGKTSTVYTLAGELGLDIYVLSLSSSGLDDTQLAQAVASVPHHGILLVEDIDCAFPSREEEDDDLFYSSMPPPGPPLPPPPMGRRRPYQSPAYRPNPWGARSNITMSGLLNVLDGVGSEEGKIFFATTNHIDRLDPALLRPGRIDRKVLYTLTSKSQAKSLFRRFYPKSLYTLNGTSSEKMSAPTIGGLPILQQTTETELEALSETFADKVPADEFTIAELQGYLLDHKLRPLDAAEMVEEWVEKERQARKDKAQREEKRRERIMKARAEEQLGMNDAFVRGMSRVFAEERSRVEPGSSLSAIPPLTNGVNPSVSISSGADPSSSLNIRSTSPPLLEKSGETNGFDYGSSITIDTGS